MADMRRRIHADSRNQHLYPPPHMYPLPHMYPPPHMYPLPHMYPPHMYPLPHMYPPPHMWTAVTSTTTRKRPTVEAKETYCRGKRDLL
jgi:hypothetical protein